MQVYPCGRARRRRRSETPSQWATLCTALGDIGVLAPSAKPAADAALDGQSAIHGGPPIGPPDVQNPPKQGVAQKGVSDGGVDEDERTEHGGRPSACTEDVIRAVPLLIAEGVPSVRAIAISADVSHSTARRWLRKGATHTDNRYQRLTVAVRRAVDLLLAKVERLLFKYAMGEAKEGHPALIRYMLERWAPEIWAKQPVEKKVRHQHEGAITQAHEGSVEVAGTVDVALEGRLFSVEEMLQLNEAGPDKIQAALALVMEKRGIEPAPEARGARDAPAPGQGDQGFDADDDDDDDDDGFVEGVDPEWMRDQS